MLVSPAIRSQKAALSPLVQALTACARGAGMVESDMEKGRSAAAVPTLSNTRKVRYTTETTILRQASKCAAQGARFSLPAKGRKNTGRPLVTHSTPRLGPARAV